MTNRQLDRRKLAAAVALIFGATSTGFAAPLTHFLTNCNDSGNGSLRAAVAAAQSGDTVQLTGIPVFGGPLPLSCSTITVTTGAIAIPQTDLTISLPSGFAPITVSGYGGNTGVLKHSGNGTLTLDNFTVADGYNYVKGGAQGGCVSSLGSIELDYMTVTGCTASGIVAKGGGVFSLGVTRMSNSTVSGNSAYGIVQVAQGGGIYALSGFSSINSVISGNTTSVGPRDFPMYTNGAAVLAIGNAYMRGTSVFGNTAGDNAGAIVAFGEAQNPSKGIAVIVESTISSNVGLYAVSIISAPPITIANSTIVLNQAKAGVSIEDSSTSSYPYMWSNIVALNGLGTISSNNIHGAGNFVTGGNAGAPVFPGDTITSGCLWLGPLRNNGGPTPTHALMSRSVAIDRGNTETGNQPLDQRGLPRTSGAAADIGAYELQKNDVIFNANFEACL